jgi:hypothetical protein
MQCVHELPEDSVQPGSSSHDAHLISCFLSKMRNRVTCATGVAS